MTCIPADRDAIGLWLIRIGQGEPKLDPLLRPSAMPADPQAIPKALWSFLGHRRPYGPGSGSW
jgi:hypothetical protein